VLFGVCNTKRFFFIAHKRDAANPPNIQRGWLELVTDGIEVYEVPGSHFTMHYSPHVEVTAKKLKAYLN